MLERHTCNNFSSGKSNAKDIMIRKRQEQQRLIIIHQNHKSKKCQDITFTRSSMTSCRT